MNQYLIAGNWKMNNDIPASKQLIKEILEQSNFDNDSVEMLVCPPFTSLLTVGEMIADVNISLGAQNCHWESKGAFTGEISCDMLKSIGCKYTIIGHSERRTLFHENDIDINKKLHSLMKSDILPIVCIGETLQEREAGQTFDVLKKQIDGSLNEVSNDSIQKIVIAYEPVWAIGTGVAATVEQVEEAHDRIREMIVEIFGSNAENTLLLYGGSVNESNSQELLGLKNVNGALVGGASLKADAFISIFNNAQKLSQ